MQTLNAVLIFMYKGRVVQIKKKTTLELIVVAFGEEKCKKYFDTI